MTTTAVQFGNPEGLKADLNVVDGSLSVALVTTPTIDIGDVTLLAGTAIIGNIGTVTKGTVAVSAGTVIVTNVAGGSVAVTAGTVLATITAGTVVVSNGAYTTPAHTVGTIGTAMGTILAANANRLYAILQNDGTAAVYINLGGTAAKNTGIRLEMSAAGASYEMSKQNGNLYTGVITGASSAGTNNILATEGV